MSEIQAAEMDFLQRVAVLRDRVKSFAIWEEFGVEPLYLHQKQPVKVVQTCDENISEGPPRWDVLGICLQEEDPG